MSCEKNINLDKFIIYECEEDKVAKIKEDIIECEVNGFEVVNKKNYLIKFIAVDNCLISSKEKIKRCDFVLQKDNETFLIELKTDVKPKNRTEKLKEALEQIKGCITRFDNIVEGFICFNKNVVVKSSWERRLNNFLEQENILVKIKCKKEF